MNWKFPSWARRPVDADGHVLWPALARRIVLWVALAVAALLLALTAFVLTLLPRSPGVEQLREIQAARPSVLLSADGKLLATLARKQQEHVPLAKVSPHVLQALVATEDQRFYDHRGIDVYRTFGAAFRTLTGRTQGGSTITQQLARNLFPDEIGRSRTLTRKLKELITALRIERAYSKEQILEIYLNSAPFLYNVIGIEMAARTYYDTSAAELDVLQSATLIGMLKGTDYYNPIRHPERARERRNVVLAQMVKRRALDDATYQALRSQPVKVQLNRQPEVLGEAPHFAVQMRKWLVDWADEHDYNVYTDGLVVHTTIDSRLQEAATRAVERQAQALQAVADVEWSSAGLRVQSASTEAYVKARGKVEAFAHFWAKRRDLVSQFVRETPQFKEALKAAGDRAAEQAALKALLADGELMARLRRDKTRLEAGFVAMDPASGEVKAWVGSRDFQLDQYDHVAQAERQPGSTFKPFVYGAALESGIGQERVYLDNPVEIPLSDGTTWTPTDMSGASGLPMTLRDGLVYSKNTITAQVAQEVGIPRIVSFARTLGVDQSRLDPVPSLALGTSPVTLLEMVTAYSTISQEGTYHKPVTIKRIVNRHGEVLAEFGTESRRAMSADAAADLIDMMRGVVQMGTGTQIRSRFGISGDVAGKTGTSQNNADGWFILMHPNLVAGAWVGFNDSRVAMRSDHWGQGGHNAILLVGDFFKSAQKDRLISTKAKLPPARRPPPVAPAPPSTWFGDERPLETERERLERERRESDQVGALGSNGDIVVHNDRNGSIVIGDKASITLSRPAGAGEPPKTAEELGRVMQAMGRDPRTGEPAGSVSASGTGVPLTLPGEPSELPPTQ